MNANRRIILLAIIMAAVAILAGGSMLFSLYETSLNRQRERLREIAQTQARLLEAMARHNIADGADVPGGPFAATLEQVRDAHSHFKGFGETGEFTLGKRDGDQIVYLLSHRHFDMGRLRPVPFSSKLGEPMRRALSGESGTIIGIDYRGERVLAAFEPVAILNLGIVAKIDMREIRAPFIKAGLIAGGTGVALILVATILFLRIGNPIVQHLEENEKKYRGIFESTADFLLLLDRDGRILDANPAACSAYGFSRDEFLTQTVRKIVEPESADFFNAVVNVLAEHRSFLEESVQMRKDGTSFPAEVRISPARHKGRAAALAAVRDITERKQAEDSLRLSHRFLQIAPRHAEMLPMLDEFVREIQIFTHCEAIGIRILDEEGRISYESSVGFSDKFHQLENPFSSQSNTGKCINLIGSINSNLPFCSENGSFYANGTARYLAAASEEEKEEARNVCAQFEYESVALIPIRAGEAFLGLIHVADSRENMVPLNMVESVEEAATHMGTAIVRVRIQEELRESESRYRRLSEHLEEQVRKQVAELRQAQTLAAIGQMVSVVAHEIRNPLLNIQMGMDALRSALNNNSETPEILKEIEHGVNLLNDTVSELLDYSRAVRLERVLQPIGEIVQQVLKALPQKLQNITVDFDWENEKREIFVDGPKMARVFMNIFTNAAEAMPEGGNLKIASTLDDSRQLSISVSDTGHGMDADDLEKLFQPFYTTKVNGTGLGLAISKKIIEAHDGSIAVSSRPANGTTVKIVLPIGLKK